MSGTSSSTADSHAAAADLQVTGDTIRLWLRDGRTVTAPLEWYPRLCDGTPAERNNWRPAGNGTAIHWPDLDEDISVGGLLGGPSLERAVTLGSWLLARRQGRGIKTYEIAEWNRSRRTVPLR